MSFVKASDEEIEKENAYFDYIEENRFNAEVFIENLKKLDRSIEFKFENEVRTSVLITDFDKKIIDAMSDGMLNQFSSRAKSIVNLIRLFYYIVREDPNLINYLEGKEVRNVTLATTKGFKSVYLEEIKKLKQLYSFNEEMTEYLEKAIKIV